MSDSVDALIFICVLPYDDETHISIDWPRAFEVFAYMICSITTMCLVHTKLSFLRFVFLWYVKQINETDLIFYIVVVPWKIHLLTQKQNSSFEARHMRWAACTEQKTRRVHHSWSG